MKVVCILSDAMHYNYIQHMPYLLQVQANSLYYQKVIPGIGFCEISEYVSGRDSLSNGNLFQITFNGHYGKKEFRLLSKINEVGKRIPKLRGKIPAIMDGLMKKNIEKIHNKDIINVRYNIPIDMLNYFKATESVNEYDAWDFFGKDNIFYQLKEKHISYDIDDFVKHNKIQGTDEERIVRLKEKIKNKDLKDFTLLYIGVGEKAHYMGTCSLDFVRILKSYDKKIAQINELLKKMYGDEYRFVFLGDHGMVDIVKYINPYPVIKNLLSKFRMSSGKDIVYFIDSTCLRLWVCQQEQIKSIKQYLLHQWSEFLEESKVTEQIQAQYGDIILLLKPGCVFYPDFFNVVPNKGMHGYTTEIEQQKGTCMIMGNVKPEFHESIELHHVKDIILNQF